MFYVPFAYSNRNFFVLIVIDGNLYHKISTLSTFTIYTIYEFLNTVDVVICNSFCIFVMLIRAFTLSFCILFETHLWISFKGATYVSAQSFIFATDIGLDLRSL